MYRRVNVNEFQYRFTTSCLELAINIQTKILKNELREIRSVNLGQKIIVSCGTQSRLLRCDVVSIDMKKRKKERKKGRKEGRV